MFEIEVDMKVMLDALRPGISKEMSGCEVSMSVEKLLFRQVKDPVAMEMSGAPIMISCSDVM